MDEPTENVVAETFAVHATGELVRLRRTSDGRPICPVCGMVWPAGADPAWEVTGERTPAGVPTVTPSWGICPGCGTEFGLDDEWGPGETLEAAWAALRERRRAPGRRG